MNYEEHMKDHPMPKPVKVDVPVEPIKTEKKAGKKK